MEIASSERENVRRDLEELAGVKSEHGEDEECRGRSTG